MSQYEFTITFPLLDACPGRVTDFFRQLTAGDVPAELPEADEQTLETPAAGVIALCAGATRLSGQRVTIAGSAPAEQFYMPFMALTEWLARWSASSGPVGYYHHTALPHPTLLYFCEGTPYMLQATGTPVSIATGEEMSE